MTLDPSAELVVCCSEDVSLHVLQGDDRLEAIIERHGPPTATFYLGSSRHEEPPPATHTCQIQAAVEVHSPTAGAAAVGPDWQVEAEVVEEVLENGGVLAEECVAETELTEGVDLRAPSVAADGVLTDQQEVEDEKVEEVGEEDEKVEEVGEVNSEQQQVLKQTSCAAVQEPDLERHLSCEEPLVEPVGVSREQASEQTGQPQDDDDEDQGSEELCCTNGALETSGDDAANGEEDAPLDQSQVSQAEDPEKSGIAEPQEEEEGRPSSVSSDGIDPGISTEEDDTSASQQEHGIQNVNGHSGNSSEEVAPSTGAEDTRSVCDSHTKSNTDN